MEKIKQYKLIIGLGVVILALAFYWYEWRPVQIKKECYINAKYSGGFIDEKTASGLPSFKMQEVSANQLDEVYKNCLREKGF